MPIDPALPMSGPALIRLRDATFRCHGREFFAGLDWVIQPGEQWALLGPNGSGKSLLGLALTGRVALARGTLEYGFATSDRLLERHGEVRRRVVLLSADSQSQLVARHSPFYQARWQAGLLDRACLVSDLLSRHEVEGVSPYQVFADGHPETYQERVRTVSARLGIQDLLSRKLAQLSQGETRKLMLARALLQQPRLLILDDPYAGLDVGYRANLAATLATLPAEGISLVFLTRHVEELPATTSHLLRLADCQVVGRDDTRAWRRSPTAKAAPALDPAPADALDLPPPLPAPPPELVAMRQARVAYGDQIILDGIDWTVRPGERWLLQGPNGSGKTTLMSLITGDNPQAYANRVRLFGRCRGSGDSIWEIKARIGWVAPEIHAHYDASVTALEVVCSGYFDSIGLHRECTPDQLAEAHAWLTRVGLGCQAKTPLRELSTGAQRLALLARALVKNPLLLVLDEPCQGLDPANRHRLVTLIGRLARQPGRGLIYVTHHQEELPTGMTHLLRLERGQASFCGPLTP